ncbi:MAG: hypothetical protein IT204_19950 [Fimbriimonadaceae bacterium]|nr:hypothetical protein [Fimbriimonadaceae bacterium]
MSAGCPGCGAQVRLPAREVERLLQQYLATHPGPLAAPLVAQSRLAICAACEQRLYGTTCRHCGCLVEIRARLQDQRCPAPQPRW